MFKQMIISSSAKPAKERKSFIYRDSNKKLSSSLDKLDLPDYSKGYLIKPNLISTKNNRCKSAKTYKEYKTSDCFPLLNLDEITKDYPDLSVKNNRDDSNDDQNESKAFPELSFDYLKVDQTNLADSNLPSPLQIGSGNVLERFRILSSKFRERTSKVKKKLEEQLSSDESEDLSDGELVNYSQDWFQENYEDEEKKIKLKDIKNNLKNFDQFLSNFDLNLHTYDLYSVAYVSWLILLNLVFLYNLFIIILRTFFPIQTPENLLSFVAFDLFCDLVYLLDILWFKSRLRYFENGQLIKEAQLIKKKYFQTSEFRIDCYSLLPLEIFYLFVGVKPILRFPRFFKLNCFHVLFHCLDSIAKYPYIFRILKTLIYMMFLVHLNASAYYFISYLNDFDPENQWVYNNEGNAYLRCFYFAIRTATSISGRMPKPNNSSERVFMSCSWLIGVFVFAFLIGQIRDIVANATQNETHYRMILDQTINYMDNLNLPKSTQKRVKDWLNFTWKQQQTFDEQAILNALPIKSCTDISLNLHLDMLKQVELFQVIERPIICEFVTKLRPILYLPGDFVFKKDDIGTDMYIVNNGKVQVFADKECTKLLTTLGKGSVFGEISVLDISGSNRRTASIKSVGYSTLFRLRKIDLLEILSDYPEGQLQLKKKANQLMKKRNSKPDEKRKTDSQLFDSIRADSVIKDPIKQSKTSKLADTVMKLMHQRK